MQLKKIVELCERYAPLALSGEYCERYGAYDNSGVIVDCGQEITGVAFALDCTLSAVKFAKAQGANLLITHHPAIYSPVKRLGQEEPTHRALIEAIKNEISVLSLHLNLDCAEGGIDEQLMLALNGQKPALMHPLSRGGYGRAYAVSTSVKDVAALLKARMGAKQISVYGCGEVKKIASFCGAGLDEETLAFAKAQGVDLIVSSDAKHHLISWASEEGIALVLPTHYAVENYGFEKFYQKIKRELSLACSYYADERLL